HDRVTVGGHLGPRVDRDALSILDCAGERRAGARLPEDLQPHLPLGACEVTEPHRVEEEGGGGDPDASWWVGMDSAYEIVKVKDKVTDEIKILNYPDSLQHRINGCFTRSMNGNPLCVPGDDCNNNKDMTAIIDYMQSLTDNAKGKFGGEARGFALLPVLTGNKSHGQSTYLQKCAFCHGADGEGHYGEGERGEGESGKDEKGKEQYYRPALWGANSFNACAGMAKTSKLAPFIKANMPFEFGGAITNQEAWNLATFIDAQCRPGKPGCSETTPNCVNGVDKVNVMGIRP
ncbi:MAG: c-type cytochrome, partial [Psychrosphaera sp.]|nr:c-type cytochrome [Psychrosphaera sp.]